MSIEKNPITIFDDLRTHTVKLGKDGPAFEMIELSGGRWEKFNQYIAFISRFEKDTPQNIEDGRPLGLLQEGSYEDYSSWDHR